MTRTLSPSSSGFQAVGGPLSADEVDHVSRWTRLVRAKLRRGSRSKPGISLRVSFGFVFFALLATCSGPRPAPHLALTLFSMVLLYELPGAVWVRALGRFVRVYVHSFGATSKVAGERLSLRLRIAQALAGTAASLAVGGALLLVARVSRSALLGEAASFYLFWGAVQLLPLAPFKLGLVLRDHVRHSLRVKQGLASCGLAVAVLLKNVDRLELPLIVVAFVLWLYACGEELLHAVALARDEESSAEQRLTEIRALILADQSAAAISVSTELLSLARSSELRTRVREVLAWAAIGAGDLALAREATSQLSENLQEPHLLASYLALSGRLREAILLLEEARGLGQFSHESVKLLADLYYRDDDRTALAELVRSAAELFDADDLARIERVLTLPATPSWRPSS